MKIIVIVGKKGRKTNIMLELADKKTREEVKALINASKCGAAISNAIANGKFIKELTEKEIAHTESDLILTETNAYWSLI